MQKAAAEEAIVKAQTGPTGEVFYIDGPAAVSASGMAADSFSTTCSGRRVRVLATQDNVELIVSLYDRRVDGDRTVIELGRPAGIDWSSILAIGPRETLINMRQAAATAPSRGGWHVMTASDYPAYAMAAQIRRDRGVTAETVAMLAKHPAYPALSFIGHVDAGCLCLLIAAILDPRWYVDPDAPDRNGRLKCYLGMISGQVTGSPGRRHRRGLVTSTWKTTDSVPAGVASPGYFLWRYWARVEGDVAKADLRTGQRFIAYLKAVWLCGMLDGAWCGDGLFVPEYFFDTAETVEAWRDFTAGSRTK